MCDISEVRPFKLLKVLDDEIEPIMRFLTEGFDVNADELPNTEN